MICIYSLSSRLSLALFSMQVLSMIRSWICHPQSARANCPSSTCRAIILHCMYDMTLSPREAIAKFQDLFNEHYYGCESALCFARSHPSHAGSAPGQVVSAACLVPSSNFFAPWICCRRVLAPRCFQPSTCGNRHYRPIFNMPFTMSFRRWMSSTTAARSASGFTCRLPTLNYAR